MTDHRCADAAVHDLLAMHALGRLSDAEDRHVRRHLDDCPSCRDELAELRSVTAALDLLSPADIAEILVADPPYVSQPRLTCRFTLNQRYARGPSAPPARRSGNGLRPTPQLRPGRPGEH